MQVTQSRSSANKSTKGARKSPEVKQKSNSFLLASKIGDHSQRNPVAYSRELDMRKQKADNTEYIRNLYKKYLGKQNNSDRKTTTDAKQNKNQKNALDHCRQKLTYQPELTKIQSTIERLSHQNSSAVFKKINTTEEIKVTSKINKYSGKQLCPNFYSKMLDNEVLHVLGDRRNTMVLAMQTINSIRQNR